MNPPPLPRPKRFPWIFYWIVLVLIIAFALAPVGLVVACGVIANAHGCKVDEGSVHPCMINGKDYGQLLYTLGVSGWLMLYSSRWAIRIHDLADRSHSALGKLAKTIRYYFSVVLSTASTIEAVAAPAELPVCSRRLNPI